MLLAASSAFGWRTTASRKGIAQGLVSSPTFLGRVGMQLNQLTVKSIANDSPESFASVTAELDLLVLPSRVEGFGMSGLYAISAHFPVLVSGNLGLGMALKKLPSGGKHVVDSEDPQVWAEKDKGSQRKGPQDCGPGGRTTPGKIHEGIQLGETMQKTSGKNDEQKPTKWFVP